MSILDNGLSSFSVSAVLRQTKRRRARGVLKA